jgi:hypothetical protein
MQGWRSRQYWSSWFRLPLLGAASATCIGAGLSQPSHILVGRHRTRASSSDTRWTLTCGNRPARTGQTSFPRLRIRRLGVRVPPSAPSSQALTRSGRGLFASGFANNGAGFGDRAGEYVSSLGQLFANDVGIDPECDRRVSVTEPGGPAGRQSRPQRAHDDRARSPGRAVRFAPGMLSPRKFTTWRIGRPAGRLSGLGLEGA